MRKKIIVIVMLLILVFSSSANALEVMTISKAPTLTFNNGVATCKSTINANLASDTISISMKLYAGKTCIKSWTAEGTGAITISKTKSVTSGTTYTLKVIATVNGVTQPAQSVTKTCP